MNNIETPFSVAAVVVLYWPDPETISFIKELNRGGWWLVVVVNSIDEHNRDRLNQIAPRDIIYNRQNLGLAYALNQGCEQAFQSGATHVLLLDQDSRPHRDLPAQLLDDLISLTSNGHAIGAIGPKLVDMKDSSGTAGTGNKSHPRFETVDTLATSGSLISRAAFESVGKMYDWLFIDDIDHEWCFRASHGRYAVIRSNRREMIHNMGDGGVTLLGRYRPLHRSPVRHYYITRNTIYLCRQPYVRLGWRVTEALKLWYRIPIYLLISTNPISSFNKIILAIIDGIKHKNNVKIERVMHE